MVGVDGIDQLALFASISGRYAGTMRQSMVDGSIGYVGPTRVVTDGVFHYVAEP